MQKFLEKRKVIIDNIKDYELNIATLDAKIASLEHQKEALQEASKLSRTLLANTRQRCLKEHILDNWGDFSRCVISYDFFSDDDWITKYYPKHKDIINRYFRLNQQEIKKFRTFLDSVNIDSWNLYIIGKDGNVNRFFGMDDINYSRTHIKFLSNDKKDTKMIDEFINSINNLSCVKSYNRCSNGITDERTVYFKRKSYPWSIDDFNEFVQNIIDEHERNEKSTDFSNSE